jgi:hypothetical protein
MAAPTHTRFHNLTDSALADAIGEAAFARRLAEAEERDLKAELRRRRVARCAGDRYAVLVTRSTAWVLDTELVKRTLGEAAYGQHCTIQARERVDVIPVTR